VTLYLASPGVLKVCMYVCMCVCMYGCLFMCVCFCVCVCVRMYVCFCVCACLLMLCMYVCACTYENMGWHEDVVWCEAFILSACIMHVSKKCSYDLYACMHARLHVM
jgi:hypothetical protein